eukprot:CAMPEP_0114342476 /NCGR_PEP_ID=MMETSP0101-20121206/9829_1 /TAXON_ID=38822 ORGANISM="Pteridomonas danica, Strain PT" /NCGR_SAMPLE_ID=MMETSP0101 /ASSEMBLY_ACC=CAM_ASM_000211 /LENGTH=145 /DNA_ID=CAMNT_0001476605 /DNA_START=668 /DNA_END=1105 /DNA_ORIENTATION=-
MDDDRKNEMEKNHGGRNVIEKEVETDFHFPPQVSMIKTFDKKKNATGTGFLTVSLLAVEAYVLYEMYEEALELCLFAIDRNITLKPHVRAKLHVILGQIYYNNVKNKAKSEEHFKLAYEEAHLSAFRDIFVGVVAQAKSETFSET